MRDRQELEQAILTLEAQRAVLGDQVTDAAIAALRAKLDELAARSRLQQRKQVTIMFVDIVGSTSLGEKLDPEELLEIMDAALTAFVNAVRQQDGEIARLMGDGLLAFFGAQQTREDDPERAVHAGLAIIAAGRAMAESLSRRQIADGFAVRVGINTGLVALGEVGTEGGAEFTAMGDAINLASRLESTAPPNSVVISHDTYRHVRGLFVMEAQAPLALKGKSDQIQSYVVVRAQPSSFRTATRGVDEIETALIGRDVELMTLKNRFYECLEEDEPSMLTIVGDAGIGKSRLLYEFTHWLDGLPDRITYFKGRASSATEPAPYGLIRDIFVRRCGIMETDSKVDVIQKFRAETAHILPAERADLIGHFIGFDFSDSEAVSPLLGSPDFKQLAIAYLIAYFRAVIETPTVLFLDDIHWADDSSLDLIARLFQEFSRGRLLVICLCRPLLFERRPHWGEGKATHGQLPLKALSRRASRLLAREILRQVEELPESLVEAIVARAEGNPFYVEELIKLMLDKGYIDRSGPRWRLVVDDVAQLPVPSTLVGVLHARLDHLSGAEKAVLQRASVVGRQFWDAVLVELATDLEPGIRVADELSSLRQRNMIFRHERSSIAEAEEYVFKHALLRDAVYETVLLRPRRRYHALVARWLETHLGERIDENLSLIAQHFEKAGELERAAYYLGRAGQSLFRSGAVRESQRLLAQALALAADVGDEAGQAQLSVHLGNAYSAAGDLIEADRYLQAGLRLAQQRADQALQCRALSYLGGVAFRRGNYAEAEAYDSEALAVARALNDNEQIAMALHGLSTTTYSRDKYDESEGYAGEALTYYRMVGDRRGEARALNQLGLMAGVRGQRAEQQAYYEQSLAAFREIGDLAGGAVVLNNLGSAAYLSGDFEAAINYTKEALAWLEELGHRYYTAYTLVSLGLAYAARGGLALARESHCRALQIASEIHSEPVILFALVGLADLHSVTEQPAAGAELLGLVLSQPAITQDIRSDAQSAEQRLRRALSVEAYENALARGAGRSLELTVRDYLADCARPE